MFSLKTTSTLRWFCCFKKKGKNYGKINLEKMESGKH